MSAPFLPPPTLPPALATNSTTMLPTRGLASLTVTTPTSENQTFDWTPAGTSTRPGRETKPSRWSSPEFRAYELVVLVGVAMLTTVGLSLGGQSSETAGIACDKVREGRDVCCTVTDELGPSSAGDRFPSKLRPVLSKTVHGMDPRTFHRKSAFLTWLWPCDMLISIVPRPPLRTRRTPSTRRSGQTSPRSSSSPAPSWPSSSFSPHQPRHPLIHRRLRLDRPSRCPERRSSRRSPC